MEVSTVKSRLAAAATAASSFLLAMPVVWADTPAEPTPVSRSGTLIALAVMAAIIVVPIVMWWMKVMRKPKDKS